MWQNVIDFLLALWGKCGIFPWGRKDPALPPEGKEEVDDILPHNQPLSRRNPVFLHLLEFFHAKLTHSNYVKRVRWYLFSHIGVKLLAVRQAESGSSSSVGSCSSPGTLRACR